MSLNVRVNSLLRTTLVFVGVQFSLSHEHIHIPYRRNQHIFDSLHMYYINLDQSSDRRQRFENNIALLPDYTSTHLKRVPAVTTADVESLLRNGSFVLNGVGLAGPGVEHRDGDGKKYTGYEVACTLSHLKAIMQAYNDGHETALIVEDDAVITTEFLENIKPYTRYAPLDWMILQWTTNNPVVNKKESYLSNDFWISWSGHHWSTIAYTIKREGMRQILNSTSNIFSKQHDEELLWRFKIPGMLVADEIVYFLAGSTYTSTYSWVTDGEVNSTFAGDHASLIDFGRTAHAPTFSMVNKIERHESIAVVESIRLRSADEIRDEICSLHADIWGLAKFHPRSQWFVKVVLTDYDLLALFMAKASELPSNFVRIDVEVSRRRFNKFGLVQEKFKAVSKFDYLLLKDNDIRLSGFEWNTFLNKGKDSVVSGPYIVDFEGLTARRKESIRRAKNSSNFVVGFQDGVLFNTYRQSDFQEVTSISVMNLEMFMVLMRSDFAIWFFERILTVEFLSQDVDWGPDLMWCSAAYSFGNNLRENLGKSLVPCSLVSVNVRHTNTKQIDKTNEFVIKGKELLQKVKNNNITRPWMSHTSGSRFQYLALLHWCKRRLVKNRINECLKDYRIEQIANFKNTDLPVLAQPI